MAVDVVDEDFLAAPTARDDAADVGTRDGTRYAYQARKQRRRSSCSTTRKSHSTTAHDEELPSPLVLLPPELLELIALHLATRPPNLGPPSALLPLLSVCRSVHEQLGWGKNWGFWARIARAKFSVAGGGYIPYDEYPYTTPDASYNGARRTGKKEGNTKLTHIAQTLRVRCIALYIIRAGDPHAHGAARALKVAYGMLVEEEWTGARMDCSAVDKVFGRTNAGNCSTVDAEGDWDDPRMGKNRRQLGWAGARAFALQFVRARLYEGRWGEKDSVGRSGVSKLHPQSLNLNSSVQGNLNGQFNQEDYHPEHHTPAWRAGWPRDTEGVAASLWVLWFFEDGDTLASEPEPLRLHLMALLLPFVVAPFRYASALAPAHHYTIPLLPDRNGTGNITVPTNHGAFPIYALASPSSAPPELGSRLVRSTAEDAPASSVPTPTLATPRARSRHQIQNQVRFSVPRARLPVLPRSRLLSAPPARLLFFARMQAGARMNVPTDLPRDRAEAEMRRVKNGEVGPAPIGPTQEDIREKNARPVVRFERQLGSTNGSTRTRTRTDAAVDATFAVDPAFSFRDCERWAPYRWRGRLCTGYGPRMRRSVAALSPVASSAGATSSGGAPPGRIGRLYALGSFSGLWAGTMLMPSEHAYNAVVGSPGGVLPHGGLVGDNFLAVQRPVYMRVREYWNFHPNQPVPPPPPDSTTADEGLREGWLPPGMRVGDVVGGRVEVQVPANANPSTLAGRGGEHKHYIYHTALDPRASADAHPAHDVEVCSGCVRIREGERLARGTALVSEDRLWEEDGKENSDESSEWPEWKARAWAAHRFDEDEGWHGACDGVQDVIFAGETDPRHGMAWQHYEYAGRVRPWDGLIGLVMRPRDRTQGLPTYFISGHLVGRDTFEGTWQMATQDVLAPSWGGSICLARGEE
ncbi:hypothetical protein B0H19DRAFT_1378753 [Mycena capillaripes]|nr:hypothetical protein B0H19DRAFT_1378753 [Mycena capillaripes]